MPIKLGKGHIFENHKKAVNFLKRTRPDIKKPDAYVGSIERKQRKFKIL